jgi:hypothetical protein
MANIISDSGSGLGALRDILASNPRVFDAAGGNGGPVGGQGSPSQRAASIYSLVRYCLANNEYCLVADRGIC